MNLPRGIGGSGVVGIVVYHRLINSLCPYFYRKDQPRLLNAALCKADYGLPPLNLNDPVLNFLNGVKSDTVADWESNAMYNRCVNCSWRSLVLFILGKQWFRSKGSLCWDWGICMRRKCSLLLETLDPGLTSLAEGEGEDFSQAEFSRRRAI